MIPVSQGKPYAGNPHVRFEEGASAQAAPRRSALLHKKWTVLIRGVGSRDVEAKDIDGAYAAAMKEYACKLDDILAVLSHTPINVKGSK